MLFLRPMVGVCKGVLIMPLNIERIFLKKKEVKFPAVPIIFYINFQGCLLVDHVFPAR